MTAEPYCSWKRLRLKNDPTADDVDWRAGPTNPNSPTILVGGTAADGTYSITIVGKVLIRNGEVPVDITVEAERDAAQTSAQMAAELEVLLDAAETTTDSGITLASLGIVASVNSATITLSCPPDAYLTLSASAPGTATITFPLEASVPITAPAPLAGRVGNDNVNGMLVVVNQLDTNGARLAPGSGTVSVQVVEICEVVSIRSDGTRAVTYAYVGGAVATSQALGTPIPIQVRGAKFWTLRILTDAALSGSATHLEVLYRDTAIA